MEGKTTYRQLPREEIEKLEDLDRRETIEAFKFMRGGVLEMEADHFQMPDWFAAEKQKRIRELK